MISLAQTTFTLYWTKINPAFARAHALAQLGQRGLAPTAKIKNLVITTR